MNYFDELEDLRIYVMENYPEITLEESEYISLAERRKKSSRHYAAFMALEKCYDYPMVDPLDKLSDILNDMNIEATFAYQDINKNHYSIAANTIEELINFIKMRRTI